MPLNINNSRRTGGNRHAKQKASLQLSLREMILAKQWRRRRIFLASLIIVATLSFYFLKIADYYPRKIDLVHPVGFFGVTFSTKFCEELKLDWKEVYTAILDDLGVKYIRIPVYWDEIEMTEGVYDFSKYDYIISEGAKRDVHFIISIGRRVPRWPECHNPDWIDYRDDIFVHAATLQTIRTIVERYKDSEAVEYWQVENEPYLNTFGVCPDLNPDFLQQEFDLVKSMDDRKIIITGSGELGSWRKQAAIGDIFGSTLYRIVYNRIFGFVKYPFPPSYYRFKAKLAGLPSDRLMVLELQAEPWVPSGGMIYRTKEQNDETMSVEQFKANLQYAINLNFKRTYAWGVEWWYFQKKYGDPEYWRIAEGLFD